jgi:hypothetical protein
VTAGIAPVDSVTTDTPGKLQQPITIQSVIIQDSAK